MAHMFCWSRCYRSRDSGFTLLEILIVVAILAILVTVGTGVYRSLARRVEFDEARSIFVADLKQARAASMSGESGLTWGIHVQNSTDDTYALFSGATYASGTISATTTLPTAVAWTSPVEGTSTDIIFSRITGTTTGATIDMTSEGVTQTITVTALGHIY